MKKIISVIIFVVMVISLSACQIEYTHGVYEILIRSRCIENNKVGNEWIEKFKCDGTIIESGDRITAPLGSKVRVDGIFIERDKYSDKGNSFTNIILEDGEIKTFYVEVVERKGSYAGNKAIWEVEVEVKLIKKKRIRN
ncbi:MAG: hypothetical protein E7565_02625 [Ruminococcaceae bacterium]|nr:hypothetical protein [Oscillospiraceae bacterium]